jgi:hypothetical protein
MDEARGAPVEALVVEGTSSQLVTAGEKPGRRA